MSDDLPAGDWPNRQASRIIEHAPHRWHVQVLGQGADLLLLHGAGASCHTWAALAPYLSDRYRLIMVDLPGHGWTRSARGRARLGDVAADLAALCTVQGWVPEHILGHSAGAAIALEMARQGKIAPKGLVLINAALENFRGAAGWLFPIMAKMLALNPFTGILISQGGRSLSQVRTILSSVGTELGEDALSRYATLIARRAHVDGTLAMMAQWSLNDLNRALPGITTPTLFLHGARDGAVAPDVARRAAARMPNAALHVFPGLGHLLQEEAPDQVAQDILRFLAAAPETVTTA